MKTQNQVRNNGIIAVFIVLAANVFVVLNITALPCHIFKVSALLTADQPARAMAFTAETKMQVADFDIGTAEQLANAVTHLYRRSLDLMVRTITKLQNICLKKV